MVYQKSVKHDVDPHVVFGLIKVESEFIKHAKNSDGSYGLMQIQARVHKKALKGKNPYDIETNLDVGVSIYKNCARQWKSLSSALNCYNGRIKNNPFSAKVMSVINQLNNH
jgi:soluble lytic murein transglycosylase-like protein